MARTFSYQYRFLTNVDSWKMKLKQKRRHNFAPTVLFDGRHTNKSSCTILIKSGNFSQLLSNYFAGMSSRFSASRSLYSQIHGISNAFSQGWVRGDTVTVTRYVRDIDEDKSRLFTETFQLPSGISEVTHSLFPVKGTNSEAIRPIFQDISPSGNLTLSLRQCGKGDEIPLINLIGSQNSHYLDVSDYHGKFVGDSWFGGVTWSHDERYLYAFQQHEISFLAATFRFSLFTHIIEYLPG